MRLFIGKVPTIAEEIVRVLSSDGSVEMENADEVRADLEAVLKEHVRVEREIVDQAKQRMEIQGLPYSQLGRVKSQLAKEKRAAVGEDALPYLIEQFLEVLFHSPNVAEVFAEDMELRKKMTPVLKRHMDVESELDQEVRAKIKNLQEGTSDFEIEYARVLDQMKRKKGLQ